MNIGIIGQGFVGNAIYQRFKNYYNVLTFDLDESKCNSSKNEIYECNIIFLCLPTPMNKDGSCHVDIVEQEIMSLNIWAKDSILVIKSTVPPGTTAKWNSRFKNINIVFNPEFLTEINAVEDFNNTTRIVLGGPRESTTLLKRVFRKVFSEAHIIKTGSTHAEMVKYVTNTFLATKVAYANEIYQICEGLKLDYDKVIEYSTFDKRLGKSHWQVPGPDGDFGYGGHCLPKDLSSLLFIADALDTNATLLNAVQDSNIEVRKNRDWEKMKGRAVI